MTPGALEGVSILIPRPEGRGNDLVCAIRALGGEAIRFPVLEIELCPSDRLLHPGGIMLDRFALAIFVSVNSVHALAEILTDSVCFPAHLAVAAIGKATADALGRLGISVLFLPEGSHDSEGLLRALSRLPVEGRNVVIYRGDAGRNVLANGLSQRGAHVYQLESYRRRPSPSPPREPLAKWLDRPKSILLVTSVVILKSLLSQTPVKWQSKLVTRPVVTLSARIASACRVAGFHGLIQVTDGTDCKAIITALVKIAQQSASRDANG